MDKNLEKYIIKIENFLDKDTCKKGIKEIEKSKKWESHIFHNERTRKYEKVSGKYENDILVDGNLKLSKKIMDGLWHSIKNYISGLDMPWFGGWSGYSLIRYNRYHSKKKMALHCDHITTLFDGETRGIPILSCLGVLNDNYEGGDFIICEDKRINFKTGDLIIFPSSFLYPHKVEPVTKGKRYSFISWVW